MDKEKKELLEKLRNVKEMEENNLKELGIDDKVKVDDVKYYGTATLVQKTDGKEETIDINVYAVIEGKTIKYYSDDMCLGAETETVGKNNVGIIPSPEYERMYEEKNPIKDLIENLKQREEQEKTGEEGEGVLSLNELELEEKEELKKKEKIEEQEEGQIRNWKLSNFKGEVNLDQQVNGETLRKILGLGEEYRNIAPVEASTVGVKSKAKYCFVAIKQDGTYKILGEDILKQDRQEGTNPYDKDTKIDRDGHISQESSIAGFKIVNRPNLYLTVGFDERSSTRETTITDVSGRNSRTEEIGFELEKKGDSSWKNSDTRNILRTEQGIGKTDEMMEKQNSNLNDRIENIDADENNDTYVRIDPDAKIPGTDITWRRFANMCGYRGQEDGIQKAYKEFKEYEAENKDLENDEIINDIVEEKENEMPGPNRRR